MEFPDYSNGIVNLMSSLTAALGGAPTGHPPLELLPPERLQGARRVLLLVIDGLGYNYLTGPGRGSRLHRHLLGPISSVAPPTTAAAIPAFLTGQPPAVHGFTGWFCWFRELGCVSAVLPFVTRYGRLDLGQGGTGPRQLCGAAPLLERLPLPCHIVTPKHIAYSIFNRAFSGPARIHPYTSSGGFFRVLRRLVRGGRQQEYIYAYWSELDALAHEHGISSPQVLRHFEALDSAFGRFLDAVAGSDTAVLVSADHGFVDTPPERVIQLDDHPELARCLALPLCGEPRLAYCYVHPHQSARFVDYVRGELADRMELFPSAELIERGLFGPGEPHPHLAERVGHYVLALKESYVLKDYLPGERPYRHIGAHGGLTAAELRVPLVFARI